LAYDPPRQSKPKPIDDPTEVALALNVRPCGTCSFFWPRDSAQQPYGPYPAYDFDANTPKENPPPHDAPSYLWLKGTTRAPSFPDGEVMDGCRKAPIMTIGINPNLTAFLPGKAGASWCYPSFSSDHHTDSWTKYAYYYRYRSVYQEHFDFAFIKKYLIKDGEIVAPRPGIVTGAIRPDDSPTFSITVRYDGDARDSTIKLPGEVGAPRYVLLVDPMQPHNRFAKGDVIAARLNVPGGHGTDVYAQQVGYYQRFVPVLSSFDKFLRGKGYGGPPLRIGEDVGQLDMVACASPHWGPQWLGGSKGSVNTIIKNCVSRNAWAMKQLLQTRPAVLFLVGEASFSMFRYSFGRLIKAKPALPTRPEDGAFTLLRATTDAKHPVAFAFSETIDGHRYDISTRIVVTPHFSYGSNFMPQFRMSTTAWSAFQKKFKDCAAYLERDPRIQRPPEQNGYLAFELQNETAQVIATLKQKWPDAYRTLSASLYDANAMMLSVLEDLYGKRQLSVVNHGKSAHLTRTDGPCVFCVNPHWKFPLGCPYGKPDETPLPVGWLEKVAAAVVKKGHQPALHAALAMIDDSFEALRAPPHLLTEGDASPPTAER
jgi:hypothetical protein